MFFGSTDLRKGVSGAKFDAESDFEIRFAGTPQKPSQDYKKLIFRSEKFSDLFFFGAELFDNLFCSDIESIESIEPIDQSTDRSNRSKAAMMTSCFQWRH